MVFRDHRKTTLSVASRLPPLLRRGMELSALRAVLFAENSLSKEGNTRQTVRENIGFSESGSR